MSSELEMKLCDPCLSAFKWVEYHAKRYTSALLYSLYLTCVTRSRDMFPLEERHIQ